MKCLFRCPYEWTSVSNYQWPSSKDVMSLTTGNLMLAAVSPSIIILRPPDKLVIEVQSKGGYSFAMWSKVGEPSFSFPAELYVHFGEIYYVVNTTTNDVGKYRIDLFPSVLNQTAPPAVYIDVVLPGKL